MDAVESLPAFGRSCWAHDVIVEYTMARVASLVPGLVYANFTLLCIPLDRVYFRNILRHDSSGVGMGNDYFLQGPMVFLDWLFEFL